MAGFDYGQWPRLSASGYLVVGSAVSPAEAGAIQSRRWNVLRRERSGWAGDSGAASVARVGRGGLI